MTRVAVFVGTRADLGPLEPVLSALAQARDMDLHVLCGVAFDADSLRGRLESMDAARLWQVVELTPPLPGAVGEHEMLEHGPRLGKGMAGAIRQVRPDVLVVLGDRWELLFVVPPAYLAGVAIVHLHGGEVTEGALDERVRHAVTKLADIHCVASADARERVLQMGEPPDRVIETGAPGLDRLAGVPPQPLATLGEQVGASLARPIALFTYHPPTAVADAPLAEWAADALRATAAHCASVIVTHPGMDPGRDVILETLEHVSSTQPGIVIIESLGSRYPSVLASVDVVVGNSSSGIIEAATAGIPAVNIGDRQAGRLHGANVVHAREGFQGVSTALKLALEPESRRISKTVNNPYGNGTAAGRIVEAVRVATTTPRAKGFHDQPGGNRDRREA